MKTSNNLFTEARPRTDDVERLLTVLCMIQLDFDTIALPLAGKVGAGLRAEHISNLLGELYQIVGEIDDLP